MKKNKGFSVIELMVVVAIVGVILSIITPYLKKRFDLGPKEEVVVSTPEIDAINKPLPSPSKPLVSNYENEVEKIKEVTLLQGSRRVTYHLAILKSSPYTTYCISYPEDLRSQAVLASGEYCVNLFLELGEK